MNEEIDRLLVSVRVDIAAFASDIKQMKASVDGPLGDSLSRAGKILESSLSRALQTGKLGFDDLKRIALSALAEIAASALHTGMTAIFGKSGGGLSLGSIATQLVGLFSGSPPRSTGGLVSQGKAYLVGERGPEIFIPSNSGRIETGGGPAYRDVRLNITINAQSGSEPQLLAQSSRQIARAVKRALSTVE